MNKTFEETELSKAVKKFKDQYPAVTSADLQTFVLGWQACIKLLHESQAHWKEHYKEMSNMKPISIDDEITEVDYEDNE